MEIPGYKPVREIARGPINTVLIYHQESLDRDVLMKILHPQFSSDPEILERFKREARFYAKLKHNNIVNVIDFGQHNNSFYIAMEYVDGWSLEEFSKYFAPVPIPVITHIMKELLAGLEFAHRSKIIHRDIKPSNILIGKDGSVKIVDFGLARLINLPSITEQGGTVGTPAYMSPEQARSENVTAVSDIFSMGVTFYEFLTERSPFAGKSIVESISSILNKHPENPSLYRTNCPDWLDTLIMKMIDKQPERRFDSCSSILHYLSRVPDQDSCIGNQNDLLRLIKDPEAKTEQAEDVYPAVVPVRPFKKNERKWQATIPIGALILTVLVLVVMNLMQSQNGSSEPEITNTSRESPSGQPLKQDSSESKIVAFAPDSAETVSGPNSNPPVQTIDKNPNLAVLDNETKAENRDSITIDQPPVLTNGMLYVVAIPWADILIDGKKMDTTPLKEALQLPQGEHTLKLENPSYISHEQEILVHAGKTDSLTVKLAPAMGYLMVRVIPWGELYLNDEYLDTTPLQEAAKLQRGRYSLVIKNPNFREYAEDIEILPGATTTKTIYLQK